MLILDETIEGIPQETVYFKSEVKMSPSQALEWLKQESTKIDDNVPLHYHRIIITPRITLRIPGKYDRLYPGDYLLLWDDSPPTHKDVCDALIKVINEDCEDEKKTNVTYQKWVKLLEDVYFNGTNNLDCSNNEKERFARQLLFWITLQEDLNKKHKLGRLTPFCRYAEALSTTQKGFIHTYEELISRLEVRDPAMLDEWDLPIKPSFYKWSAF